MARYPLERLLTARFFREEAAERELRLAERRLEEAREAEAEARENMRRHRQWRPKEEERLFGEIRGAVLPQSGLDAYRGKLSALRQTEIDLEEACREAENLVRVRMGELENAKRLRVAAVRDRQKIDAHRDTWQREEARRVEKAEESELEDFSVRTGPDADAGEDAAWI